MIYHLRISPLQQFATNSSCLSRQRRRSHSAVIQLTCKGPENVLGERGKKFGAVKRVGRIPKRTF